MSLSHTQKATNAHSTVSLLLLLLFFKHIFATYANCRAPLTNRNRERTYFFSQHKRPLSTPKQNCKMQFFLLSNTSMFTFSLFPSLSLCSFLNVAHFERKHIRTCALLHAHTHTNTYAAVFLALTLSPIWNSHSAMSSDSNESASTNARLTDFVAMLLLLLVLEIDGNDKWRQRDVATTSTHRQLTRQSHSTAAQQAAQAWNIKRGSFAVAVAVTVTDAALLSTFASSQIHAYVHTNTRAWWTSRMRVFVCVQWGFFWWVFRCGKFHK